MTIDIGFVFQFLLLLWWRDFFDAQGRPKSRKGMPSIYFAIGAVGCGTCCSRPFLVILSVVFFYFFSVFVLFLRGEEFRLFLLYFVVNFLLCNVCVGVLLLVV